MSYPGTTVNILLARTALYFLLKAWGLALHYPVFIIATGKEVEIRNGFE